MRHYRFTARVPYNDRYSYSAKQSVKSEREKRCLEHVFESWQCRCGTNQSINQSIMHYFLCVQKLSRELANLVCPVGDCSRRLDQPHKMPDCRVVALSWYKHTERSWVSSVRAFYSAPLLTAFTPIGQMEQRHHQSALKLSMCRGWVSERSR